MRIDLLRGRSWDALNKQYRSILLNQFPAAAEPTLPVQIYIGYAHALWEAAHSLAKLFSHKRTIAIVEGNELVTAPIAEDFSEAGYTILDLKAGESLKPVPPDLLFVVHTVDDPVTGAVINKNDLLVDLKDSRVFSIAISHAAHKLSPLERPAPFDIKIFSLSPDRALLLGGERCRISPTLAKALPWPNETVEQTEYNLTRSTPQQMADLRQRVTNFESRLPEGFRPYFGPNAIRVYDRAVIYNPEFDGSAIIDELARLGGFAADNEAFEATSSCRWQNPRFGDWLRKRGESEALVGSLVVIDAHLLEANFSEQLATAAKNIRALQGV